MAAVETISSVAFFSLHELLAKSTTNCSHFLPSFTNTTIFLDFCIRPDVVSILGKDDGRSRCSVQKKEDFT